MRGELRTVREAQGARARPVGSGRVLGSSGTSAPVTDRFASRRIVSSAAPQRVVREPQVDGRTTRSGGSLDVRSVRDRMEAGRGRPLP